MTEVVGEFPELQGLMGTYYAEAQARTKPSRTRCEDTIDRKGPTILCRRSDSVSVALADKIDTLVGFWSIDEKPTDRRILTL